MNRIKVDIEMVFKKRIKKVKEKKLSKKSVQ